MPENVGTLEQLLRRIIREEMEAALAARDERLRTVGRIKTGAVSAPVEATPANSPSWTGGWEEVEEFALKSGSKTYTVRTGNPVKVKGLGRGGSNGDGYTVIGIKRRKPAGQEEWDINVEVRKGVDHTRTVKSDRIIYKRPKKGN